MADFHKLWFACISLEICLLNHELQQENNKTRCQSIWQAPSGLMSSYLNCFDFCNTLKPSLSQSSLHRLHLVQNAGAILKTYTTRFDCYHLCYYFFLYSVWYSTGTMSSFFTVKINLAEQFSSKSKRESKMSLCFKKILPYGNQIITNHSKEEKWDDTFAVMTEPKIKTSLFAC